MATNRWVFVTDRVDAHVDRFDRLFASLNPDYELLSVVRESSGGFSARGLDAELTTWEEIDQYLGDAEVVISGPLDTVSAELKGGPYRHVGISWATDVMVSGASSADLLTKMQSAVTGMSLVVTDNYATENALISLGVSEDAVIRIPWGAEETQDLPSPVSRASDREKLGLPVGGTIIFYPRSLEPHYDSMVFVTAFGALLGAHPEAIALLVESGSEVSAVKRAAKERGIADSLHWIAPQPPERFRQILEISDLVVVTPRTDGTSVTVMEAMAAGIPVVSSLTSGSAEWVINGITGWSFPVGDSQALSDAMMRRFSSTPDEIHSITERAKTLVDARAGWARSSRILGNALKLITHS